MQHLIIFSELLHELRNEFLIVVAVGDVLGDAHQISQQADPEIAAQGGPGEECVQVPPQVQVVQTEPPAHHPQDVGHEHTLRHLDSASHTDRGPGHSLDVPLFTFLNNSLSMPAACKFTYLVFVSSTNTILITVA